MSEPDEHRRGDIAVSGIKVTALDVESGETNSITIQPGNYVLICAEPAHVHHVQATANGTVTIVLHDTIVRPGDLLQ
jgi:hypothetical protein